MASYLQDQSLGMEKQQSRHHQQRKCEIATILGQPASEAGETQGGPGASGKETIAFSRGGFPDDVLETLRRNAEVCCHTHPQLWGVCLSWGELGKEWRTADKSAGWRRADPGRKGRKEADRTMLKEKRDSSTQDRWGWLRHAHCGMKEDNIQPRPLVRTISSSTMSHVP